MPLTTSALLYQRQLPAPVERRQLTAPVEQKNLSPVLFNRNAAGQHLSRGLESITEYAGAFDPPPGAPKDALARLSISDIAPSTSPSLAFLPKTMLLLEAPKSNWDPLRSAASKGVTWYRSVDWDPAVNVGRTGLTTYSRLDTAGSYLRVGTAWLRFERARGTDQESAALWSAAGTTALELGPVAGIATLKAFGRVSGRLLARLGWVVTGISIVYEVSSAYDQGMRDRGWVYEPYPGGGRGRPGVWVGGEGRPGPEVLLAPVTNIGKDAKELWRLRQPITPRTAPRRHPRQSLPCRSSLPGKLAYWKRVVEADAARVRSAKGNARVWAQLQFAIDLQGYWGYGRDTRRKYVCALADGLANQICTSGVPMMRPKKRDLARHIRLYLLWSSGLSNKAPWQVLTEEQRTYLHTAGVIPKRLIKDPRKRRKGLSPAEQRRLILARHGTKWSGPSNAGGGAGERDQGETSRVPTSTSPTTPWEKIGISKEQYLARKT